MREIAGKAIVVGYNYSVRLVSNDPLFPASGAFTAQIRTSEDSEVVLTTLTSSGLELARIDDNTLDIIIPAAKSAVLPVGRVVMDIVNTAPDPDQYIGIKIKFIVEKPVTRGL